MTCIIQLLWVIYLISNWLNQYNGAMFSTNFDALFFNRNDDDDNNNNNNNNNNNTFCFQAWDWATGFKLNTLYKTGYLCVGTSMLFTALIVHLC